MEHECTAMMMTSLKATNVLVSDCPSLYICDYDLCDFYYTNKSCLFY